MVRLNSPLSYHTHDLSVLHQVSHDVLPLLRCLWVVLHVFLNER